MTEQEPPEEQEITGPEVNPAPDAEGDAGIEEAADTSKVADPPGPTFADTPRPARTAMPSDPRR